MLNLQLLTNFRCPSSFRSASPLATTSCLQKLCGIDLVATGIGAFSELGSLMLSVSCYCFDFLRALSDLKMASNYENKIDHLHLQILWYFIFTWRLIFNEWWWMIVNFRLEWMAEEIQWIGSNRTDQNVLQQDWRDDVESSFEGKL